LTLRSRLKAVGQEPLFHFVVLGFLIWGAVHYWAERNDRYTIHIGLAQRQRIAATYLQQFGQPPTSEQLSHLIDRYVQEQIAWREGVALGLGQDDEVVRRRIIQKFEFLQTDLAVPEPPSPAVLERWFDKNKMRYLKPERVAFSQIYFSPDRGGEAEARSRAVTVLRKLPGMHSLRAPQLGDEFPGPTDVGTLDPEEARRLFGQSELAEQLFTLPVGSWAGPYRSGFGWHLIYVTDRVPSSLSLLAQAHDQVLADYLDEQRRLLNARNFETLRAKYTIVDAGERR